ncbi:TIGR02302 family protein [Methylobacterium oryzihabitans]|uniref:TIGR02302 family protein n=1 Tax=Methylobacterium oryzihabitans TaxID=2499852 RepID=A0A3S2XQ16_9HYPH|nr:TIGR02302 family protein [Methylobacterium oryzihabitans]RVU20169.1 TIGR02302 family protein [Methylobacterium oryzihabitans]
MSAVEPDTAASRPTEPGPAADRHLRARLDRLVALAGRAALWEQAWPVLWRGLAVVLVFLTVSWLGLWLDASPLLRMAGLGLFVLALLAALFPLVRLRTGSRAQALARIDRDAGLRHGPARALEDTLAIGQGDPATRALWDLHRRRAAAAVNALRVGLPSPGMARRDPFALRAGCLLAAVAAAFVAGPEAGERVRAAFDWRGPAAAAPSFRVDGWIDPPLYTRMPPLIVTLAEAEQRLRAPVNATLVVRIAGQGDATVTPGAGLKPLPPSAPPRPDLREERFTLTGGTADVTVQTGLVSRHRLVVETIPDHPPEIAFAGPPEANGRGTFTIAYTARDDYGIASAEGAVEPLARTRPLVAPPRLALSLPADAQGGRETRTLVDLTDSPWAGARVNLTLVAKDEAGQEGRSPTQTVTLPGRFFAKPLARSLAEERRRLVLDPDGGRRRVQASLDALLIAPERFTPEWGVFLGLKDAARRLRAARDDAALVEVADWLWAMALQIEEGDLSDAEKALRAAQDRLKEAVDRGAPDEEIKKLADDLRQAMDRFLKEFAQRMQKEQQSGSPQQQQQADRTITPDDLDRMLNQMQEAMKRGDVAEAQRLLDQLRGILENLQMAQPGSRMSDPAAREMSRQMQDLENMAREQQGLRDETFRQGQERRFNRNQPGQQGDRQQNGQRGRQQQGQQGGQQPGDQPGQQGQRQQGQQGQGGVGERQQALRQRLEELQKRMKELGMQGEQGLADAEQAMRDAEQSLGQGQEGSAVDAQGRALEGLQRGTQGMAQQMQQMGQDGDQPGEGQQQGQGQPGQPGRQGARDNDPLGRPTRNRDYSDGRVRVPTADESGVERARRILEELRRKLGDPNRAREELDYFERLLRRN